MMRITRTNGTADREAFITEGLYEGELTTKVDVPFWGAVEISQALLKVTLVKKTEAENKFDAIVSVNQRYVASSYYLNMFSSFLPETNLNINAEITVDYSTGKITAKRMGSFLSSGELINILDIAKETDGTITTNTSLNASLAQFSLFAKVKKQPAHELLASSSTLTQ